MDGSPLAAKKGEFIRIPAHKLDEGLELCALNIQQFVCDARVLVKKGSCWHAIALVILALEELAKYWELRRGKSGGSPCFDSRLFGKRTKKGSSHDYKIEKARELMIWLDNKMTEKQKSMRRLERGLEEKEIPPVGFLQAIDGLIPPIGTTSPQDSRASERLRLDCVYVDWCDSKHDWVHGPPSNAAYRIDNAALMIGAALAILKTREGGSP